VLLDPRAVERCFFREGYVGNLIDDHISGRRDNAYRIWALIQLELWLRMFIDAHTDAPLSLATAA
jgi:hypothetical protein